AIGPLGPGADRAVPPLAARAAQAAVGAESGGVFSSPLPLCGRGSRAKRGGRGKSLSADKITTLSRLAAARHPLPQAGEGMNPLVHLMPHRQPNLHFPEGARGCFLVRHINQERAMPTNAALMARRNAAVPRGVAHAAPVFAARADNAEIWDVEG